MARAAGAHEHEGGREVDRNDLVPLLILHHHEQVVARETGVVDQNIEPAKLGDGLVDQLGHLRFVAEIARQNMHAIAKLGGQPVKLVPLPARYGDGCTLTMQRTRNGAANSTRRARDQRCLVVQLEHRVSYCVSEPSTAEMSCGVPTEIALSDGSMRFARPAKILPDPIS